MQECTENCGCKVRIKRNENDIQSLGKEVNNMKKMVITAMWTVIIQAAIFAGGVILLIVR